MAATITKADKTEQEIPGVFRYIVVDMLKINKIPSVVLYFRKQTLVGVGGR